MIRYYIVWYDILHSYLRISADIISSLGAASINCCQEFVDPGITKPKLKNHSENKKCWGASAKLFKVESIEYVHNQKYKQQFSQNEQWQILNFKKGG